MSKKPLTCLLRFSNGVVALMLLVLLSWPANALACACCAEAGTWYDRMDRIDSYERDELDRLRFDSTANTYMTEAGEDAIKGISTPADDYKMTLTKRRGRWELRFKDKQGRTGTLTLTMPTHVGAFGADLYDASATNGALLYKEWRLSGALSGTGIFKRGITPQTKYRLVLQGRGNNCTSAEIFTNWTLQVYGPRTSYAFYGKLNEAAPAKS